MTLPLKYHQSGVVLITGLIILLVMTIIGFAAIQSSTMQEKMAGNTSERNEVFQAAETALKAGEDALIAFISCTVLRANLSDLPNPDNWNNAGTSVNSGSCANHDCRYVLTEIPAIAGDDESTVIPTSCNGFYFVSAKAETEKGMYVVLQSSTFRKN